MTNKPIDTVRLPGGLKASIWLNTSEAGKTYASAEITRSFKTDDGWKETNSYSHDDLLKLSKLAQLTYDRVTTIRNGEQKGGA